MFMRNRCLLLFAVNLLLATGIAAGEPSRGERDWKSADGEHTTRATFKRLLDSKVTLTKADGTDVTLAITSLSGADRRHLTELLARPPVADDQPEVEPVDYGSMSQEEFNAALRSLLLAPGPEFKKVHTLDPKSTGIMTVGMTPDGSYLMTSGSKGPLIVWDLKTGEAITTVEPQKDSRAYEAAISPDGSFVARSEPAGVVVYRVATGEKLFTHEAPKPPLTQVRFSYDGAWLATVERTGRVSTAPVLGGKVQQVTGEDFANLKDIAVNAAATGTTLVLPAKNDQLVFFQYFGDEGASGVFNITIPKDVAITDKYVACSGGDLQLHLGSIPTPNRVDDEPSLFWKRMWFLMTFRTTDIELSAGGEWLAAVGGDGDVEIRRTALPKYRILFKIDVEGGGRAISGDGRTVAFRETNGAVSVWKLPDEPREFRLDLHRLAHQLLYEGQFEQLDWVAEWLESNKQSLPPGIDQYPLDFFMRQLSDLESAGDQQALFRIQFKVWLQQRPNSTIGALAAAHIALQDAWQARGNGPAATVTEEGWEGFRRGREQCRKLAQPLVDREQPNAEAFPLLFADLKSGNWTEAERTAYIKRLTEQHPDFAPAYVSIAEMLMPRWGGQPGQIAEFVDSLEKSCGEKNGKILRFRIASELTQWLRGERLYQVTGLEYDEVMEGAWLAFEKEPQNIDFIYRAMQFAHLQNDKSEAVKLHARLISRDNYKFNWQYMYKLDYRPAYDFASKEHSLAEFRKRREAAEAGKK